VLDRLLAVRRANVDGAFPSTMEEPDPGEDADRQTVLPAIVSSLAANSGSVAVLLAREQPCGASYQLVLGVTAGPG
jgi:hypothetical protein